ncbi:MAG: hypothetical protein ACOVQ2_04905 [Flavobacterium sp.]|jgi:hypothetical protein
MKPTVKATLYNFLFFVPIYSLSYFILRHFNIDGLYIPLISALITIIFAPKFSTVKTQSGEKIFMKIIFKKEVIELK